MEEVKKIAELAKQLMLQTGNHAPLLFVKGEKAHVAIELRDFGDTNEQRVLTMLNAGTMAACKHNIGELDLIVLVNEAWFSMNPDMLPSQDPKRTEILLINSLDTRTQEENLIMYEVIRNPQGTVVDLKDHGLPNGGSVKGTLLPAFQRGYQFISPVLN